MKTAIFVSLLGLVIFGIVAVCVWYYYQHKKKPLALNDPSNESKKDMSPQKGKRIMWGEAIGAYLLVGVISLIIHCAQKIDSAEILGHTITPSLTFLWLGFILVTSDGLILTKKDEYISFYSFENFLFKMGPGGLGFRFRPFGILTILRTPIIMHETSIVFDAVSGGINNLDFEAGEDATKYAGNHLHKQLKVKVIANLKWYVDDPRQFNMKIKTAEKAAQLFLENAQQSGRAYIGRRTPAMMNANLESMAKKIRTNLEEFIEKGPKGEEESRLGIDITDFIIIDIVLDEEVLVGLDSIALSEMTIEKSANEAKAVENIAEGEKKKRTLEGEGAAAAITATKTAENNAEIAYLKAEAEVAGTENGIKVMKLRALEKFAPNKALVLNGQSMGLGELFATAKFINEQGGTQ